MENLAILLNNFKLQKIFNNIKITQILEWIFKQGPKKWKKNRLKNKKKSRER